MGFDDLARHMAARDGKKAAPVAGNAKDFIAQAQAENRRLDRRNNLILGAILLVGGIGCGILGLVLASEGGRVPFLLGGSAVGVIVGAQRIWFALRH
jgi:hypothetical protein